MPAQIFCKLSIKIYKISVPAQIFWLFIRFVISSYPGTPMVSKYLFYLFYLCLHRYSACLLLKYLFYLCLHRYSAIFLSNSAKYLCLHRYSANYLSKYAKYLCLHRYSGFLLDSRLVRTREPQWSPNIYFIYFICACTDILPVCY